MRAAAKSRSEVRASLTGRWALRAALIAGSISAAPKREEREGKPRSASFEAK